MFKNLLFLLTVFAHGTLLAQSPAFLNSKEGLKHVQAELVANHNDILLSADREFKLGVLLTIEPGWHIYWKNPGEAGQPTQVVWSLPPNWTTSELKWPYPIREIEKGNITTYAYKNEVLLFSTLIPPPIVPDMDEEIQIEATVSFLVCKDRCVPGRITLDKKFTVSSTKVESDPVSAKLFNKYEKLIPASDEEALRFDTQISEEGVGDFGLLFALLLSFLGGMILNIMPCVLPILALKIFSISQSRDKTRRENRSDAFWFSLGVLITFFVLASIAVGIKQTGTALGWGFQFQYPGFVFGLIVVLFILSLGFFDLYIADLPFLGKLANYADSKTSHSRSKNFFDGVLITLLSTPCTAPFLGTALVYAFTRSTLEIFLVFTFIGLGLLAPFVFAVNSDRFLKLFPKPGPWMQVIKELLGLGLLGTIIWLLQVASKGGKLNVVSVVGELLVVFVLFWGFARLKQSSKFLKLIFFIACLYSAYIFWPLRSAQVEVLSWKPYSRELVHNTDGPVFIDFTAEWCITCKYNENFILSRREVVDLFEEKHITLIKADWTSGSEEITKALEEYGGAGVPHYVYISAKGEKAVILPSLLSVDILKSQLF